MSSSDNHFNNSLAWIAIKISSFPTLQLWT